MYFANMSSGAECVNDLYSDFSYGLRSRIRRQIWIGDGSVVAIKADSEKITSPALRSREANIPVPFPGDAESATVAGAPALQRGGYCGEPERNLSFGNTIES
jgi:hypothetical protein